MMRLARLAGVRALLGRLQHPSDGQDLIEYALLIALISATLVITITGLGGKVPGFYTTTAAAMPGGDQDPSSGNPGRGGNPGNGNPGNDNPVGNPGDNPGNGNGNGGNPGNGKNK